MSARIVITTSSIGSDIVDELTGRGFEVAQNPYGRALRPEEVADFYAGAVGAVAGTEPLTRATLASLAPTLRVISRVGVGTDAIDVEAARDFDIRVANTPTAHVDAVAELALAGMLDLARRVSMGDRVVRGGGWKKPMGILLRYKAIGFVGYGRVARALRRLLMPFDVLALATDPVTDAAVFVADTVERVDVETMFRRADIVSLHVPGGPSTKRLVDERLLGLLKPGALLINTARGDVVAESDLVSWLKRDPSAGAYLDVFESEPYKGPLTSVENCVLTAHVGSYAREARVQMERDALANLLDVLEPSGRR